MNPGTLLLEALINCVELKISSYASMSEINSSFSTNFKYFTKPDIKIVKCPSLLKPILAKTWCNNEAGLLFD